MGFPRFLLAGLKGGSGKTLVSLGIGKLLREKGYKVKAFKKGPDYIDAKWLSLAVGEKASNLDPFLFPREKVKSLFFSFASHFDLALVEGNRGLFDGKDIQGSFSTAELSRLLNLPVIVVADCTKVTRTMAAIVLGLKSFEPGLNLAGIILNQTAGPRHRQILRESIEYYTDVPVLGALPKLKKNPIPERHMGLVSDQEYDLEIEEVFSNLARIIAENVDVERVLEIANTGDDVDSVLAVEPLDFTPSSIKIVDIGVMLDKAFWFYYEENLRLLEKHGAKLHYLSIVEPESWPELDGLYLGGGFPETLAFQIAKNKEKLALVKEMAEKGLPIYAECGGLMLLGKELNFAEKTYPLSNVFPLEIRVEKKPKGHGYVEGEIILPNPYFPVGYRLSGHEFHYSHCPKVREARYALRLNRGVGICKGLDGLVYKNVFAAYTHIHALGHPLWAENFVLAAKKFRQLKKESVQIPAFVV